MTRHLTRPLAALLLAIAGPGLSATLWAQDSANATGFTVAGAGVVRAKPDHMRIEVRVSGRAEVTDDALVKYADARRRLVEALEKLKLPNLKIDDRTVSLATASTQNNMGMMNGNNNNQDAALPIEVSGKLRIELAALQEQSKDDVLKTLGKMLDAIKDAGTNLGPSQSEMMMAWRWGEMPGGGNVKFLIRDCKQIREQAYELAVKDARARAERLANLLHAKVGRVKAVHEIRVAGDNSDSPQQFNPWYYNARHQDTLEQDEILTDTLADVPVTVRLMVQFEILDPDPQTAAVKP